MFLNLIFPLSLIIKLLHLKSKCYLCSRTLDVTEKTITFEKQKITDIKNIVWTTGFKLNFDWINVYFISFFNIKR
jgi:hypothetical protein